MLCWTLTNADQFLGARIYIIPKIAKNKIFFDRYDSKSKKPKVCLEDLNLLELFCKQRIEPRNK